MKKFFRFILCLASLSAMAAKDKAPVKNKKVAFLGDSLTEGYGVLKEEAFPALIEKSGRAQGAALEVINAGISGSTSASGPSRLKWLLKSNPHLVVLELGANDGLRGQSPEAIKNNLTSMIQMCKSAGVKIMIVAMKLPGNYGSDYRKKFQDVFEGVAKAEKVELLPFLDEFFQRKEFMQADGLHPNAAGHRYIAEKLSPLILKGIADAKN